MKGNNMKKQIVLAAVIGVISAFADPVVRVGSLIPDSRVVSEEGYSTLVQSITNVLPLIPDKAEVNAHLDNSAIHVTTQDKNRWDGKQNAMTIDVDYVTPAGLRAATNAVSQEARAHLARLEELEANTNSWSQKQDRLVAGTDYAVPSTVNASISLAFSQATNEAAKVTETARTNAVEEAVSLANGYTDQRVDGLETSVTGSIETVRSGLDQRLQSIESKEGSWDSKQDSLTAGTDYATPSQLTGAVEAIEEVTGSLDERVTAVENKTSAWDNKQDPLTAGTDYATPGAVTQGLADNSAADRGYAYEQATNAQETAILTATNSAKAYTDSEVAKAKQAVDGRVDTATNDLAAVAARVATIEGKESGWDAKQNTLSPGIDYVTPGGVANAVYPVTSNLNARIDVLEEDLVDYVPKTTLINGRQIGEGLTLGASDVHAANEEVENTVLAWEGYWGGSNVCWEVTNYYANTSGELPKLRLLELVTTNWTETVDDEEVERSSKVYREVWNDTDKFDIMTGRILGEVSVSNAQCKAAIDARIDSVEDAMPSKAWGRYAAMTGALAPTNTVYLDADETVICAGLDWQTYAVPGAGNMSFLVSRGTSSEFSGEAGTFRITDAGGTNYFGYASTQSFEDGLRTDGITVNNDGTITLTFNILAANEDPIIEFTPTLDRPITWTRLSVSTSPVSVQFDAVPGPTSRQCVISGLDGLSSGFFRAFVTVTGQNSFVTNMRAELMNDVRITIPVAGGGRCVIKPVATVSGSTTNITWTVE